jgi:hypothetical protein
MPVQSVSSSKWDSRVSERFPICSRWNELERRTVGLTEGEKDQGTAVLMAWARNSLSLRTGLEQEVPLAREA